MGIFSLFGKKKLPPDRPDENAFDSVADASGFPQVERRRVSRLAPNQVDRRGAARVTVMKIDAIETEMTLDILGPPSQSDAIAATASSASVAVSAEPEREPAALQFESTLMPMEAATEILLDNGVLPLGMIEESVAGSAQDIEEVAILFASKQDMMAESILRQAIQDGRGRQDSNRVAWWMLFDLYQVLQRQADFENLSIDYASQFETSPPAWIADLYPQQAQAAVLPRAGMMPTIAFSGRLDQGIAKQLQRVQTLAPGQLCRLEFARVTEVEPIGCALLLSALHTLQHSGHELVLVGAAELADKVRAIVKMGRLDETATTWLLLLEILRLLNREKEFEEASLDYCVTFEVSPPQFEAPGSAQVSTVTVEAAVPDACSNQFLMPSIVDGDSGQFLQDLLAYAEQHQPVLVDCSRLARIEFVTVGQILSQLAPLAGAGKIIEFHGVNHLVSALFNLMGLNGIAKIILHPY